MDQIEFNELHESCVTPLDAYVAEAEKTAAMLAKCTPEPLPIGERVKLTVQEAAELSAHSMYLAAKRLLHEAGASGLRLFWLKYRFSVSAETSLHTATARHECCAVARKPAKITIWRSFS